MERAARGEGAELRTTAPAAPGPAVVDGSAPRTQRAGRIEPRPHSAEARELRRLQNELAAANVQLRRHGEDRSLAARTYHHGDPTELRTKLAAQRDAFEASMQERIEALTAEHQMTLVELHMRHGDELRRVRSSVESEARAHSPPAPAQRATERGGATQREGHAVLAERDGLGQEWVDTAAGVQVAETERKRAAFLSAQLNALTERIATREAQFTARSELEAVAHKEAIAQREREHAAALASAAEAHAAELRTQEQAYVELAQRCAVLRDRAAFSVDTGRALATAVHEHLQAKSAAGQATADLARDPPSVAMQEELARAHAAVQEKAAAAQWLRSSANAFQQQLAESLAERDAEWEERARARVDAEVADAIAARDAQWTARTRSGAEDATAAALQQRDAFYTARLEDADAERAALLQRIAQLRATHAAEVNALHVEHDGAIATVREHSAAGRAAAVRAARAQHTSASSVHVDAIRAEHAEELSVVRAQHSSALSAAFAEHGAATGALRGVASSARERALRIAAAALSEARQIALRDARDARARAHEVEDAVERAMRETRERNSFLERRVAQREAELDKVRADLDSNQKIVLLLMRQQTRQVDVSATVERSIQPLGSPTHVDELTAAEQEEENKSLAVSAGAAALSKLSGDRFGHGKSRAALKKTMSATAFAARGGSEGAPHLASPARAPLARAASVKTMRRGSGGKDQIDRGPPPEI